MKRLDVLRELASAYAYAVAINRQVRRDRNGNMLEGWLRESVKFALRKSNSTERTEVGEAMRSLFQTFGARRATR